MARPEKRQALRREGKRKEKRKPSVGSVREKYLEGGTTSSNANYLGTESKTLERLRGGDVSVRRKASARNESESEKKRKKTAGNFDTLGEIQESTVWKGGPGSKIKSGLLQA